MGEVLIPYDKAIALPAKAVPAKGLIASIRKSDNIKAKLKKPVKIEGLNETQTVFHIGDITEVPPSANCIKAMCRSQLIMDDVDVPAFKAKYKSIPSLSMTEYVVLG